jgi:GNAT superfamily N-acetyltransferase
MKNKIYQTRKARLEDLPILLEFEQGIIEFERPFDPTLKDEKISYYDIKAMLFSEKVEVLVVVDGEEVVASGYARIEQGKPYLKHVTYGYLGFMFVKESHRGKGINKLIIDGLQKWCVSKNMNEIRLDVYAENPGAIKAYEKAGFKSFLANMRKGI